MANAQYEKGKIVLEHSKNQVKKAGECIRKENGDIERAIEIIQQYRAAHLYPLMIIKNLVWKHAQKINKNAVIARRLKRLPTIIDKLRRKTLDGKTPNSIAVTRMSDIGGCRVIVEDKLQLLLLDSSLDKSRTTHNSKVKDYIKYPKPTGYRGIHRIYTCYDKDESHQWKGFDIEVQLRTKLQHLWATTVEVVDLCEGRTLKTNPFESNSSWIDFFKLMSEFIADEEEFITLPPQAKNIIKTRLISLNDKLNAIEKLRSFNRLFSDKELDLSKIKEGYVIIALKANKIYYKAFKKSQKHLAVAAYSSIEKDEDANGLFVEMDDLRKLSYAYPNYLIDTRFFIDKFELYTSTNYWTKHR
ncbi:TPA: RelA/SpoT domain-containing protein [Klebsiella pneumoniae]|nr:RelA/SpoT domain-containing protein [Klebsiella variicola]HBW7599392.1 RelA/SpoT domain-containing protein [Klebsiella pneumoniae]